MYLILLMRYWALIRHKILVDFFFPNNPEHDLEMAKHVNIVKAVYGF